MSVVNDNDSLEIEDIDSDDEIRIDDIALQPNANADPDVAIGNYISEDIRELYDIYSYRHAASIFRNSFRNELNEIETALRTFRITTRDIGMPGGNESIIPKKFSQILRPLDWVETRIQGDLLVRLIEQRKEILASGKTRKTKLPAKAPITLANYIDGHKIDYVKGSVALDLEWNSKDQTFDRDLYALRIFHECGIISVAALITRSEKLNPVFAVVPKRKKDGTVVTDASGNEIPCMGKYGASTTWMGKLLYRLNAGRHGGCPVLVFGIRPDIISDWPTEN